MDDFKQAIDFLIDDEREAYEGYIAKAKELSETYQLPEELTEQLLFIANEELNHIVILKTILEKYKKLDKFENLNKIIEKINER